MSIELILIKDQIQLENSHQDHGDQEQWIRPDRFSEWFGDAEAKAAHNVLHGAQQVEGSVLSTWWIIFN